MEGNPMQTPPGEASPKPRTPLLSTSTNPTKRQRDTSDPRDAEAAPKPKRAAKAKGKKSTFDVTGSYELTCANRCQPVDTKGFVFNIHLLSNQLWATFRFEKLEGVMRLCPFDALKPVMNGDGEESDRLLGLEDFEMACVLGETVPGPRAKEWLMRWRGRDCPSGPSMGGETRAQGQFNFKQNQKSSSIHGMTFACGMIYNTKHLIFHGSKISPSQHSIPTIQTLEQQWKSLFQLAWEDVESDAESNGSFYKKPNDLPTGGVIKAKNKPGPNPGFMPDAQRPTTSISSFAASPAIAAQAKAKANAPAPIQPATPVVPQPPKARVLEERPGWAWDLTGEWEITNPALATALGLYEPEPESDDNFLDPVERPPAGPREPKALSMTLRMENPSQHGKGRQLWAQFEFGQWEGCMRFCPSAADSDAELSYKEFEQACVLKDGIWPGPLPRGVPDWDLRWRAFDVDAGEFSVVRHESDDYLTRAVFRKGPGGRVVMEGQLVFDGEPVAFEAVRVGAEPAEHFGRRGWGPKERVEERWENFKPRRHTKYVE